MAVTRVWTNPETALGSGGLNVATDDQLPETYFDALASCLDWLGGTTGAWVDFTPTMTQGVGLTITVTRARYMIMGKTAVVQMVLSITSAGTGGSSMVIASIPAAIAPAATGTNRICGTAHYSDGGAVFYVGAVQATTSSTLQFRTNASTSEFGANPAVTAASGDTMSLNLSYEIA